MTREELKEHCEKQIEMREMWAIAKGEKPGGKVYEEHKLILELLEQEPCEKRKHCPYRHENGNCLKVGGFCTSVDDKYCLLNKTLESCEDCISRAGVEQTVEDNILCYTHSDRPIDQDPDTECHMAIRLALRMLRKDLRKLPSVQPKPKIGHWIPCSERLPEIRQHVLCQCRGNNYSVLRLNHNGDWECIYPYTTYMQSFVIAWMSLPKPYRAESEEV